LRYRMMILTAPSAGILRRNPVKSMAESRRTTDPRRWLPFEARISLILALATQTSSLSQRLLLQLARETAKYVFPNRRFVSSTWEEAFMSVPDLETVEFKVLSRRHGFEIREVQGYTIAETTMPGKYGFDFVGASKSFNALAEYLFGKNTKNMAMEMTTPVFSRRDESERQTTPAITTKAENEEKWKMSFVLPSKYDEDDLPLPKDSLVRIEKVPRRIIAVVAFSGFVSDEEVRRCESSLRDLINKDSVFRVKEGASIEIAQYNPPFTLPFSRRNEISVEVERKDK
ncbi:hypothetical protein M569_04095, partial [Genlisea aurea]